MSEIWQITSSFKDTTEAASVAHALLENRLVACVNITGGVLSLYRWKGILCEEGEVLLLAKTSKHRVDDVIALIKKLHSYELPCIAAHPLPQGYAPFMQWVIGEVS